MEHNSLGSFIAALRKASGMTQKDLADRLHVSDKTVSRWERDDGAPDLSVIPVLAEIFGVTCDELLRGRRNAPVQQVQGELTEEKPSPKASKERQRLIKTALIRYSSFTYIAMGIAVLGLVVALICNQVFYRGTLGFLLGIVFLSAGVICQAIAITRAVADLDEDLLTPEECAAYREKVFRLASLSFGCTAALLGFTAPMLLAYDWGLSTSSLLFFGALGVCAALVLYALVRGLAVVPMLVRKGFLASTEASSARFTRNRKLLSRCAVVLTILWVLTGVGLGILVSDPFLFAEAQVFTDYDSFVAFMEQRITVAGHPYFPDPDEPERDDDIVTLECAGKVLCSYHKRNYDINLISYGNDDTMLPITVLTGTECRKSFDRVSMLEYVCYGAFILDAAAVAAFYWLRRAR